MRGISGLYKAEAGQTVRQYLSDLLFFVRLCFPVVECKACVLFGHNIERAFVFHCQRLAIGKLHVGLNREPAIAVGRHGNAE